METAAAKRKVYTPFILSAVIVILDQLTKYLIVLNIPYHRIGQSFLGGFLRIIHTRNLGVAFSIGYEWPPVIRKILFILLPIIVIAVVVVYFFRSDEVTASQRWCLAGIVGGGIGNLIDRIFRPLGVVDWIDVKFYGLFGMERFPTFNIADSSVVVCGILLFIILIMEESKSRKSGESAGTGENAIGDEE